MLSESTTRRAAAVPDTQILGVAGCGGVPAPGDGTGNGVHRASPGHPGAP